MGLWGFDLAGPEATFSGGGSFSQVETVFMELVQVYSVLCRVPWLMRHHIPGKSLRYTRNVGNLFR
jgi:hypothetical protein